MAVICLRKQFLRITTLKSFLKYSRRIYNLSGKWDEVLENESRIKLESYWLEKLKLRNETLHLKKGDEKPKFYLLSMFPYPSGRLHMGHVRVYTISDTIAHFHRMNGKQVLHPMGWDSFGLPAENAAIERGLEPSSWTYSNIRYMRKQLQDLATCFNWDREVTTCSPDYYRWTQSIFLKLFKAGLAFQKEAVVNWDPVDQTVLAKEQVDENGCSWRSGAKVEEKLLKQWFLKMSHFSKALSEGLDDLPDWPEGIRSMQKDWIGDCSGATFDFRLQLTDSAIDPVLQIHTFHPEAIFGGSFIVLSPNHTLMKKQEFINCLSEDVKERLNRGDQENKNINLSIRAVNPMSGLSVPVFVSSEWNFPSDVDVCLGIPAISEQDHDFAIQHQIDFQDVLDGENLLKNSGRYSGMERSAAKEAIIQDAKDQGVGGTQTSARMFDWLVSRQRYWGTPIPIIHCKTCQVVPVPEEDLPITLPILESFSGKGVSPLAQESDWLNVTCPKCGEPAKRETDTMDTFVDSSWYFLRYTDANNANVIYRKGDCDWLMPVDLYIGGKEHAIMHLLYARFINQFLHSKGMVAHKEPFRKLLVQGLVMGQSYKVMSTGKYLSPDQVDFSGKEPVEASTGEKLEIKWEKMSKSKYNGVDPEDAIAEYGIDTIRLFILNGIPPYRDMLWNVKDIQGILRWRSRMWRLIHRFIELRETTDLSHHQPDATFLKAEKNLLDMRNKTVAEVTKQYEEDHLLSVCIARLTTLTNHLRKCSDDIVCNSAIFEDSLCSLSIMLAPMAPLMTAEMWSGLSGVKNHLTTRNWDQYVWEQPWPTHKDTV